MTRPISFLKKQAILAKAFMWEDLKSRFDFFGRYLWIFFGCITYKYVFKAALLTSTIRMERHTISFPLFLVSGLGLVRFILFALKLFETAVAHLRNTGMLQPVLVSPTRFREILLACALWKGAVIFSELAMVILSAKLLLGTPVWLFLRPAVVIAILLTIAAYAGIGLIVSSIILTVRKGQFLYPIINQVSLVFGGVFFPTHVFPRPLDLLVTFIPIVPALKVIRYSLAGAPSADLRPPVLALAAIALAAPLLGACLLKPALEWARKNGKL